VNSLFDFCFFLFFKLLLIFFNILYNFFSTLLLLFLNNNHKATIRKIYFLKIFLKPTFQQGQFFIVLIFWKFNLTIADYKHIHLWTWHYNSVWIIKLNLDAKHQLFNNIQLHHLTILLFDNRIQSLR